MDIPFTPFVPARQKKEYWPQGKPRKASRTSFVDLTGRRFGRWLVLRETPKTRQGQTRWHCRCDCGKEKPEVLYGSLVRGLSESCGCLRMEQLVKPDDVVHSGRNPAYRVWVSMKTRCFNERHPSYRNYGARGITMCPQWAENFDQFLKDMGPRPEGMTIERVDNSRGYEPGNCQWGTRMEQAGNTRRNIVTPWKGVQCNLIDVARMENVDYPCLSYRYQNKGMPIEEAVAELQRLGYTYHERAQEAGSTRTNKTDEKRLPRNFWNDVIEGDLTGKTFGRWTVLSEARQGSWNCRCSCGVEKSVLRGSLTTGESLSCGCLKREKTAEATKLPHQRHSRSNPTWRIWAYRRHLMPPEWRNSFDTFLADMGPRPDGHRLVSMDGRRWDKETCEWRARA